MSILINDISSGITGMSCLLIAYQLGRFLFKRWQDGIPFRETVVLAAALFFMGGIARTILVFIIQNDTLDVAIRLLMSLISMLTAVLITLSVNQALKMKTPRDYEELTAEKNRQLKSLRRELKFLSKPQHERQRN